jgi:hypothetical protein
MTLVAVLKYSLAIIARLHELETRGIEERDTHDNSQPRIGILATIFPRQVLLSELCKRAT